MNTRATTGIVLALLVTLSATCLAASGAPDGGAGSLRLERMQVDGNPAIVVTTKQYTATLRPAAGGALSSLSYDGAELIRWSPERPAGLFQEAGTAGKQYEVLQAEKSNGTARVRLRASDGGLRLTKTFIFPADGRTFRVRMAIRNRNPYPLSGPAAPRFYSFMSPSGKESSGVERICLDAGRGGRVMGPGVFARRYSSPGAPDGTIRWVACADVASRRGLAVDFRDTGAQSPHAALCGDKTGVSWSTPAVPAGSTMRTEARVVIWDGMGAVTAVTDRFLARATVQDQETPLVELKMKALGGPLNAVTVISRLYGTDGNDVGVGQSMAFESVTADKVFSASAELPGAQGRVGWLQQTVRSEGEVAGRHTVPLGGPGGPCPLEGYGPPAPTVSAAKDDTDEPSDGEPWNARLAASAPAAMPDRLRLHLASNEAETLFLAVTAQKQVEELSARLEPPPGEDAQELPPGAATVWSVTTAPEARMSHFEPTAVEEEGTLQLALRVNVAGVGAGRWRRRLVLEGGGKKIEVPLQVTVKSPRIQSSGGFGLWLAPGDGADLAAEEPTLGRLAAQRVTVVTWPVSEGFDPAQAGRVLDLAAGAGLDGFGFQRSVSSARGPSDLAAAGKGDVLLPAGAPVWLLRSSPCWFVSPAKARESGFSTAGVAERIPAAGGRDTSALRHVLLERGLGRGKMSQKIVNGDVSGDARVWLFHPMSGGEPGWAAPETRSAAWAAAWQGMAGLAVDPLPGAQGSRSPLLEVARDAREEAALWRQCRDLATRLRDVDLDDEDQQKRRAIIMEDLRTVLGREDDCRLRIAADEGGLRPVLRTVSAESGAIPSPAAFRDAKRRLLDLLERIRALLPDMTANLYWRGQALVEDGQKHLRLITDVQEASVKAASAIQTAVESHTGQTIKIASEFPAEPMLETGDARVVWVLGDPAKVDGLPETLAERAETSTAPVTGQVEGVQVIIMPGQMKWARRLIRGLSAGKHLYPPASEMR